MSALTFVTDSIYTQSLYRVTVLNSKLSASRKVVKLFVFEIHVTRRDNGIQFVMARDRILLFCCCFSINQRRLTT